MKFNGKVTHCGDRYIANKTLKFHSYLMSDSDSLLFFKGKISVKPDFT